MRGRLSVPDTTFTTVPEHDKPKPTENAVEIGEVMVAEHDEPEPAENAPEHDKPEPTENVVEIGEVV